MKTAELIGTQLDYWVARAQGKRLFLAPPFDVGGDRWQWTEDNGTKLMQCPVANWHPSTDWAQGGPLIDKEEICTSPQSASVSLSNLNCGGIFEHPNCPVFEAETTLIAAMRAIVFKKFGAEVPDIDTPSRD